MNPFAYLRADSLEGAVQAKTEDRQAQFIGGGTNLLDLIKYDLIRPSTLIDINRLPLTAIGEAAQGGLLIGALVTNSAAAYHEIVQRRYPLLTEAILAGASPQLRNMATIGGNLLQRTRCGYFYNAGAPCNKRVPGSGCSALEGVNRMHAILGASDKCIAVHPSDMAVALAALDARVHVNGPEGERIIPILEFHRLPGEHPECDTNLGRDEIITAIELPPRDGPAREAYVKVRERTSYAFALVSAAVALDVRDGSIVRGRVALGGVAHKPWRRPELEALLQGQPDRTRFQEFAHRLLEGARGYGDNNFKLKLAPRVVVLALEKAWQHTTQQ